MKSKILVSSILTIALCFSLIVGSTFALFTSEDQFDISVTAGKVDLDASIANLKTYSADEFVGGPLVDENGAEYIHVEQPAFDFANGGYANWNGSVLTLTNITPGDAVTFDITGTNNGNVTVLYRYSIAVVSGDTLMSGLDVSVGGTKYEALKSYVSGWTKLESGDITPVPVVIELPVWAGNEYQGESCEILVKLEAVQGNAAVTGVETVEQYPHTEADLVAAIAAGGEVVLGRDVELSAGLVVNADTVLDLNGHTISFVSTEAKASSAITNKANLTIVNGTVTYEGVGDPSFGYGTNTINTSGKLVIDNATIVNNTNSGSSVAIDCSAGAELIVESGEIISQKNAIRLCPFGAAAINCTINGGTITGARAIQIQLPSNTPASAPEINLTVNGGELSARDVENGLAIYSYSAGQSFENVNVTITGGVFNGHVAFGGGSYATTENVVVTGGTFNGSLGRYLANNGWEDITVQ